MNKRLADRIALVTGASRGIGRAVALELAREGAHVIALARTVGALEELDDAIKNLGATATLVPLDLKDGAAMPRLRESIVSRWGKLDILIGNAGILGPLTPVTNIKPNEWVEALEVNVNANLRLIQAFDALLKRSDAGRAVFITTSRAFGTEAYWGPYNTTKAALDALVKTYAAECANTSVRVNLFSPGGVRTAMYAKAFPGADLTKLRPPEDIAPQIVALALPGETRNGEVVSART